MNSFPVNRRHMLAAMAVSIPALMLGSLSFAGISTTSLAAIGKAAPAFEVIDASKNKRTLAEFKGKTIVLEWTSPSCPFAKAQYDSGKMHFRLSRPSPACTADRRVQGPTTAARRSVST